ncbi:hypothetical protein GGX14DRAFT_674736 [Mycena pura]|uniref:DUF6589 domain-containing protein n=1 Tax=Mycena pura TaxID=153505 RepID=A0AAD6Y838_9AGAR|nr:hypothetical protein GGX14DRAFT_674736 [Mycena pura]
MADFRTGLQWAETSTPLSVQQPLSPYNWAVPSAPHATTSWNDIERPITEPHFYNFRLNPKKSPPRVFSYSLPQKRSGSLAASQADENVAPGSFSSSPPLAPRTSQGSAKRSKPNPIPLQTGTTPAKRKSPRTDAQKIDIILTSIQDQGWSLSCFLYNGAEIHRSSTHAQMVSIFLAGRGKKTVANVITEWMSHPDGRIPTTSPNSDLMYSTTVLFTDIGPVRAALTTFSTQTIGKKVADEAESAVKLGNGLHVHIGKKPSKHPGTDVCHDDFGESTIPRVQSVIEKDQAVTLYLFKNIAMRKPRTRGGVVIERRSRPADSVITHAIASLNFCRTPQANLLPLMRGILYFGSSAPVELMNYNSRIGTMSAPTTIRRALIKLSQEEGRVTADHGRDPMTAGFLFVDNTQNYARQREQRMGRETVMNVGMSGLWFEAPDVDVEVFDLAAKRALIAKNLRKDVTVDDLLGFLDQQDADLTGTLHVLDVLVRCTPSLKPLRKEISMRFSATAKLLVPSGQAIVHPLACSGRKETIPTELKDGMCDFLEQIGQTPESFLKRKLPVGGDGLTFAMLLQLQTYLQFHDDAFKSFEILEPQLQVWHTKWTDVIRIFQTHWGRVTGKNTNPASLGFSAAKIGRAAPSNVFA